jgi:hypothetical protein
MIVINPSSGPVADATEANAWKNVEIFVADMHLAGVTFGRDPDTKDGEDGRFAYVLRLGDRTCTIDMPGLPTENVRFLDSEGQNIWHFPRLYVQGSSWVWKFALPTARRWLTGGYDE